jgi:hypothetical protein
VPALTRVRQVSRKIAIAIAAYAFDHGLAGIHRPPNIPGLIDATTYQPEYQSWV